MPNDLRTPGPWFPAQNDFYWSVESNHPDYKYQCVADLVNSKCVISSDGMEHDHGEANARLIAAAPELLGALKRIEPILTTLSFSEAHFQFLEAVRATIRKAEGDNDVE